MNAPHFWSDFLYPLLIATGLSLPSIVAGSAVGALLAGSVVAAERRSVPFRKLAPFAGASFLLLLFYPRQISQASLNYLVSLIFGVKFGQGTWGLIVTNIPTSAGVAYLLFSTTILLSDYFRLPAAFIRNSGKAPFVRTLVIATIPVRQRVALVIAVICCTVAFQAAMLGKTGSSTAGTQIQRGLVGNHLTDYDRVLLLSTSIAYLVLILCLVTGVAHLLLMLAGWMALRAPARSRQPLPAPNARLIKGAIGLVVLLSFCVSIALHLFLIIRLMGLAHALLQTVGVPAGQLEQTWPTFGRTWELLDQVPDYAMGGAMSGCMAALCLWFLSATRAHAQPPGLLALYGPPGFACLAFLPSTFIGSLSLAVPGVENVQPLMGFLWGAFAAGGFTCLLVSHHLLGSPVERYANVRRIRGLGRAFGLFVGEYWLLAAGIIFAILLGNLFDAGYRDQLGLPSLGKKYVDRQGGWDADRRGLALLLMVFATGAVWILTSYSWKKSEEVRNAQ